MTEESGKVANEIDKIGVVAQEGSQVTIGNIYISHSSSSANEHPENQTSLYEIPSCPYRGLLAFQEEDAAFFFGRDRFLLGNGAYETGLIKAAQDQPLVAIIGSSGSGKSSVVFAGLIPSLRLQQKWLIESFRPEQYPFYTLASALVRLLEPALSKTEQVIKAKELAKVVQKDGFKEVVFEIYRENPNKRLLLFVDQFEELYTLCPDTTLQQKFIQVILDTITDNLLTLVFTLRADFYGHVLSYRPFRDVLQRYTPQLLSSMEPNELQETIEKPIEKLGVQLESGLTQRILEDVGSEPGNLPLLEFALTRLWQKQQNRMLTHQAYDQIFGVKKALADYAEEIYARFSNLERQQVQKILVKLVQLGDGTEDTRRLATRSEIGNDCWKLITRNRGLTDCRLVVTGRNEQTGDETVEIIHEALIHEWQRLRGWIDLDRTFSLWQGRLRVNMQQWLTTKRDSGDLLRGATLIEAENWFNKRQNDFSEVEHEFILTSLNLREQEQNLQKQQQLIREHLQQQVKQRLIAGLVVSLLLAGVAGVGWWQANTQWKLVEYQRKRAELAERMIEERGAIIELQKRQTSAGIVVANSSDGKAHPSKIPSVTTPISSLLTSSHIKYKLTQNDAENLLMSWLKAKRFIFSSPFDSRLVEELTTGPIKYDLLKPNGSIDWLRTNNAFYQYGQVKVQILSNPSINGNTASFEARVTEERTFVINGVANRNQSGIRSNDLRYKFLFEGGRWRLADYEEV